MKLRKICEVIANMGGFKQMHLCSIATGRVEEIFLFKLLRLLSGFESG